MSLSLRLRWVPGTYSVARLAPTSPIPTWAGGPGFMATVQADDELTIVCLSDRVPDDIQSEGGWVCLRTIGPFEFQATGVVQALIQPLSNNGVGVFVLCTFDGEHLLVSESDREKAETLLLEAGHTFAV